MFSTFNILVLYLIIPSRYANIPPASDDVVKTLSFNEEQVKKELDPIVNNLNKIIDPSTKIEDKIELKGIIRGKVETIIEHAIEAKQKIETLFEDRGILKTQKDKADMYQLLLALTFRVDSLEMILAPNENFKGQQRSSRWNQIFKEHTPVVENFRRKVLDGGFTETSFADQVERLMNERNHRAGLANIPLPRFIKEKTIEGALEIMEIIEDEKAVEAVKILVAPVKGLDFTTSQTVKTSAASEKNGAPKCA